MIRNLLDEFGKGLANDPMRAAQRAMRPSLPRRFYKEATAEAGQGSFLLLLDGKTAKTPARHPLALPSRSLADAVAAEWAAQGEFIDPAQMPLTRLANVAIDRLAREADAVADEIVKYAASDLICYRAAEPEGLDAAQRAAWDPVIEWARTELGAEFVTARDLRFVEQPPASVAAVRAAVAEFAAPFALAALASATALTGSVLIALALGRGHFDSDAAWSAAHVDEDWNIQKWGEDVEAMRRRAARYEEFRAAAFMLKAAG
jgi:chaperone required for assembly of F1-ATPase